jgi:hypothetical protein
MLVWDEVEKMLSQTMINDPHWACATWSCLVIMLGDGYINDSQRYKSMQHIILVSHMPFQDDRIALRDAWTVSSE